MSKKESQSSERREGTDQVISHLLTEREQLLRLILQASKMSDTATGTVDRDLLDELCQLLVDYIAAGHFGLYERIVEGTERRKGVAELAVKLYPRIDETTQAALAFNERYDASRKAIDIPVLHEQLAKLGEELAHRIEYEDQLIEKLSRRS